MGEKRDAKSSRLRAYRAKRSPGATPEPFGALSAERPNLFVVQQHAARRLHYDFRLEIGGVLRSWAVPKGPSLDPTHKRLAVETEDHPLEYGDFEGVIPAGNYGAGAVIIWDRGQALHELDPEEGVEKGKLLFELRGFKLRGLWTLVRTQRNPKEWLLIKKPDSAADGRTVEELDAGSVLSGLDVEELAAGNRRAEEVLREVEALGAPRRRVDAVKVKPMLARLEPRPFSRPGWLFELKYDGYRLLAARAPSAARGPRGTRAGEVRLFYRSGIEATAVFPELVRTLEALPHRSFLLDGEVVVLADHARPSFELLQQRATLSRKADIERATLDRPAVLYAFDLLAYEDFDLRPLPLRQRKEILRRVLPGSGPVRFSDHVEARGEDFYREVRRMDLEGMVAKRADSPYRGGRSANWIKVRADRVGDFVVVGFTLPEGSRNGFGALHLGVLQGGRMSYAGRVGSGFAQAQLADIRRLLETMRRKAPPFGGPAPAGRRDAWVEPRLVAEVRFSDYTAAGQLRHPVFLRLRDDKSPGECVREGSPPPAPEAEPADSDPEGVPEVRVSRPDKVFWPEEGYSKGDLATYYRAVARYLLPYLRDRPVVLDRYPDGIRGKSFFQKNAPEFAPSWVRTESLWSEDAARETRYFICDDEESLIYLINLGTIPLHLWTSRVTSPHAPDWCVLDLDAKQSSFAKAVTVARAIRKLCKAIGLSCYVKTSGATGLHVLIPLGGQCTFAQSKQLAALLAQIVARQLPEQASVARSPRARQGKVYIDALQNGYGKLLVAPYSARPLPGATVSMPLNWREVNARLDPRRFTIATAPARIKRWRADPVAAVLTGQPDLVTALGRLLAEQG